MPTWLVVVVFLYLILTNWGFLLELRDLTKVHKIISEHLTAVTESRNQYLELTEKLVDVLNDISDMSDIDEVHKLVDKTVRVLNDSSN